MLFHLIVSRVRNDLFLEQAEGYVKALEKSTSSVFNFRKVFEHGTESFSAKGKEEEILFEGPSCPTLELNRERWSGRVIKTAVLLVESLC